MNSGHHQSRLLMEVLLPCMRLAVVVAAVAGLCIDPQQKSHGQHKHHITGEGAGDGKRGIPQDVSGCRLWAGQQCLQGLHLPIS